MRNIVFVTALVGSLVTGCSSAADRAATDTSVVAAADSGKAVVPASPGAPAAPAEWTIMVFMNADNNLDDAALLDLEELSRAPQNAGVRVVVQVDRAASGSWSQTLRFAVRPGFIPEPGASGVEDLGEQNMGDPAVLREFVRTTKQRYPARKYSLIIWGHGQGFRAMLREQLLAAEALSAGAFAKMRSKTMAVTESVTTFRAPAAVLAMVQAPTRSVSSDETSVDQLYNAELHGALEGAQLDVLGFDACLMSMVETAYLMRDVARYMVASEELVPGYGWAYDDWLSTLAQDPKIDGKGLAQVLVGSYKTTYDRMDPSTTLSAIDLSQMGSIATTVDAFARVLSTNMDRFKAEIAAARADVRNYAPSYTSGGYPMFQHVDLAYFAERVEARIADPAIRSAAAAVRSAIRNTSVVISAYAGTQRRTPTTSFGSFGMAIYFPASRASYLADPYGGGYLQTNTFYAVAFVKDHLWDEFLHEYFNRI
jgi:hypothetical protein